MLKFILSAFCSLLLIFLSNSANSCSIDAISPPKVLLVLPRPDTDPFWHHVKQFGLAVSESLCMDLSVVNAQIGDDNRFFYVQLLNDVIEKGPKPDLIVGQFFAGGEKAQLEMLARYNIPFISFNSAISKKVLDTVGMPTTRFKNWLAHISPDEYNTGKQLSMKLLSSLGEGEKGVMIGIGGSHTNSASVHRMEGLQSSFAQDKRHQLLQAVYTNYTVADAKLKTEALLSRHHLLDINLIWTASDDLALGVIGAVEKDGKIPGKDILVGGIDWNESNFEFIRTGKMEVSYGGHFIEAGIAILLGHDYLHGIDFTKMTGSIVRTELFPLDKKNINQIGPFINPEHYHRLDFKVRSMFHNPHQEGYELNINSMLRLDTGDALSISE